MTEKDPTDIDTLRGQLKKASDKFTKGMLTNGGLPRDLSELEMFREPIREGGVKFVPDGDGKGKLENRDGKTIFRVENLYNAAYLQGIQGEEDSKRK